MTFLSTGLAFAWSRSGSRPARRCRATSLLESGGQRGHLAGWQLRGQELPPQSARDRAAGRGRGPPIRVPVPTEQGGEGVWYQQPK